jgi:tetratricopeptide (TPR) repeat protein
MIVAKALEKERARRYASAADMARDIRRHLGDQPIAARPPSAGYQMRKFARRHKPLVAGTMAVFLALAAGVVVSAREAIHARQAEHAADQEAATAQAINDFFQNCLLALARAPGPTPPPGPNRPELNVRAFLSFAAARVAARFNSQPEIEAGIRYTVGSAYLDLGVYTEARKQFERALDLQRRFLHPPGPHTQAARSRLGRMAYYLGHTAYLAGKGADQEATLRQALEFEHQVWPPEYPETLETIAELALVWQRQGMYTQAERPARELVAVYRTKHPDDWRRFRAESLLGASLAGQKQYIEAEPLLLEGYRGMLARESRMSATDRDDLAQAHAWLGQLYEASGRPESATAGLR